MNILSLFDGMSCGQIALNRCGIKYDNYYASEIDNRAIKVTQHNYPNTIQLGDVTKVKGGDLPKINLLIGGSPCQGFSFAGKGLNFEDPRSKLFFEYVRILKELREVNPDVKFLLENVQMKREHQLVISNILGIAPIVINSSLVSAQNRVRLYWTNIGEATKGLFEDKYCAIPQPIDKGIFLRDVLEDEVDEKYFLSETALGGLKRASDRQHKPSFMYPQQKPFAVDTRVGANTHRGQYICHNMMPRSGDPTKGGTGHLSRIDGKTYCLDTGNTNAVEIRTVKQLNPSIESGSKQPFQQNRIYSTDGIAPALCAHHAANTHNIEDGVRIRRLTPIECERLQTVPDNYTACVSDSQRYKMLGNGWTVAVIEWIYSFLPQKYFL